VLVLNSEKAVLSAEDVFPVRVYPEG